MTLLTIFGICFLTYEFSVRFVQHVTNMDLAESRKLVNHKIYAFFHSNYPEPPSIDVFLSETEWKELEPAFTHYYDNAIFFGCRDIPLNGVIEVSYRTSRLHTQYQDARDSLAQSITIDIINFYYRKRGYNVCVHIKTINEYEVTFYIAYNNTGLNWINTLLAKMRAIQINQLCNPYTEKLIFRANVSPKKNKVSNICIGFRLSDWKEKKVKTPIYISLKRKPHLLLTGESGSGKSYCLNIMLFSLSHTSYNVWFGDFKASEDFLYLSSYRKYASGNDVEELVNDFYTLFEQIRNKLIKLDRPQILVLDEYPSFIQYLTLQDKKHAESIKQKISTLLMLGRSIGETQFAIWLTSQRADASIFSSGGARDNFMTWISLGNISSEAKHMITSDSLPDTIYDIGEGIIKTDGSPIDELIVPAISNMDDMNTYTLTQFSQ